MDIELTLIYALWFINAGLLALLIALFIYWVILLLLPYQEPMPRRDFTPLPVPEPPVGDSTEVEEIPRFIVLSGLPRQEEIPIPNADTFLIGRFEDRDQMILVAFDEQSVSRRHATFRIGRMGREYYIRDENSSYGTHLLRYTTHEQYDPLQPGEEIPVYNEDIIQFGMSVRVRLILPTETRSSMTEVE